MRHHVFKNKHEVHEHARKKNRDEAPVKVFLVSKKVNQVLNAA